MLKESIYLACSIGGGLSLSRVILNSNVYLLKDFSLIISGSLIGEIAYQTLIDGRDSYRFDKKLEVANPSGMLIGATIGIITTLALDVLS